MTLTHPRNIRPHEATRIALAAADHGRPAPDPDAFPHGAASPTFTNPIVQQGQDPHVVRHDGQYYLIMSEDDRRVTIRRSPRLTTLGAAPPVVVWEAAPHGDTCAEVWAPELFLCRRPVVYLCRGQQWRQRDPSYVCAGERGTRPAWALP